MARLVERLRDLVRVVRVDEQGARTEGLVRVRVRVRVSSQG